MAQVSASTLTWVQKIQLIVAVGFGSGWSPKMPGTVGTAAAVVFFLPLAPLAVGHPFTWAVTLLGFLAIAVWAADGAEKSYFRRHDVGNIVIDEFLGYFVTMTFVPQSWRTLLAGFVLFRLLDVTKPWPANHIDKKWPGGWGVVMDDVAAGIWANVVLLVALRFLDF